MYSPLGPLSTLLETSEDFSSLVDFFGCTALAGEDSTFFFFGLGACYKVKQNWLQYNFNLRITTLLV